LLEVNGLDGGKIKRWRNAPVKFVSARLVRDGCPQCRDALLLEAQSLGGLPLSGEIAIIPDHWLNYGCPHGLPGLGFELNKPEALPDDDAQEPISDEVEVALIDTRMDATKNIGYPVREHGPYGSHPMHDDFDDDSSPDGSGTY
jgi:hypothetical protein